MNKKRQSGLAMVELALILPLLLAIFFGIVELGRALYQQNILEKNVANTVRMLARSYLAIDVHNGCTTDAMRWPQALQNAENFLLYGSSDADTGAEPLLVSATLESVVINAHDNSGSNISDYICSIVLTAEAQFTPLVSDLLGIGAFTLTARAEERYIGE